MSHPDDRTRSDGHRYAIRVDGHLHPRWSDSFDGMTLTPLDDGTSVLEGPIADQAALHGLLRAVRDLGIPLLSLHRLDEPGSRPGSPTDPASGA